MEPKKNPKYDVHRKRNVIFNLSLALSLGVVIAAFKWAVPIKEQYNDPAPKASTDDVVYVPITDFPKKQQTPTPRVESKPVLNPVEFIVVDQLTDPDASEPDQYDPDETVTTSGIEVPAEVSAPVDFIIVENMPEPVGGYERFYKTVRKNLTYPAVAKRLNTEGKVIVQFVVNEKGEPCDFTILRSLGSGCDEEAIRVLSLCKWNPGKQRGVPVRVKMIQAVTFALTR